MPQIKVGETVEFTVGAYNSIGRGPSQQAHGTWYYSIKGMFAGGDKLQGTAHLIWSMLECWPGAGGVVAITRTGQEDFSSSIVTAKDGQPPKLEEYNAAARSFSLVSAVATGETCPNEIDGTGPALQIQAPPAGITTAAAPAAAVTAVVTGAYGLQELGDLAEQCMTRSSEILQKFGEAGWTIDTPTAISLGQSMFNQATRLGIRVEPPAIVEEELSASDAAIEAALEGF